MSACFSLSIFHNRRTLAFFRSITYTKKRDIKNARMSISYACMHVGDLNLHFIIVISLQIREKSGWHMKSMDFLDNLLCSLTVRLIMTPKDGFVTCRNDEPITLLVNRLKKFDSLPVSAKKIKYFVSKTEVERFFENNRLAKVKDVKQPISEEVTISDNEQIHNYFLKWKEPLFVTKQNEVVGIVTPADLNKIPSKMVFYILISSFEELLIKSIKSLNVTPKKIKGYIGFTRWWDALGRYIQAREENFGLSWIECLNTRDLIDIACSNRSIRKLLNYSREIEARESLKSLAFLRNKVMHAGYIIIQNEKQLIKRRAEYRRIRQHIIDLT